MSDILFSRDSVWAHLCAGCLWWSFHDPWREATCCTERLNLGDTLMQPLLFTTATEPKRQPQVAWVLERLADSFASWFKSMFLLYLLCSELLPVLEWEIIFPLNFLLDFLPDHLPNANAFVNVYIRPGNVDDEQVPTTSVLFERSGDNSGLHQNHQMLHSYHLNAHRQDYRGRQQKWRYQWLLAGQDRKEPAITHGRMPESVRRPPQSISSIHTKIASSKSKKRAAGLEIYWWLLSLSVS